MGFESRHQRRRAHHRISGRRSADPEDLSGAIGKGRRRVTAVAQHGLSGFGISSDEILKPLIRVLVKTGDEVFMEVRPRASLVPGEYAIIGDDLTRVVTFRVAIDAPR